MAYLCQLVVVTGTGPDSKVKNLYFVDDYPHTLAAIFPERDRPGNPRRSKTYVKCAQPLYRVHDGQVITGKDKAGNEKRVPLEQWPLVTERQVMAHANPRLQVSVIK